MLRTCACDILGQLLYTVTVFLNSIQYVCNLQTYWYYNIAGKLHLRMCTYKLTASFCVTQILRKDVFRPCSRACLLGISGRKTKNVLFKGCGDASRAVQSGPLTVRLRLNVTNCKIGLRGALLGLLIQLNMHSEVKAVWTTN